MQPTKGDLEKAKGVYNLLFRDTSYTNNWVDEDNINEIAQALASARAEAAKETIQKIIGIFDQETEKTYIRMIEKLKHSLTGEEGSYQK